MHVAERYFIRSHRRWPIGTVWSLKKLRFHCSFQKFTASRDSGRMFIDYLGRRRNGEPSESKATRTKLHPLVAIFREGSGQEWLLLRWIALRSSDVMLHWRRVARCLLSKK